MARGRELLPGQSGIKNQPLIVPTHHSLVAEVRQASAGGRTTPPCATLGDSSGIFEPVPAAE